jgi:SlyX protein
MNDRLVELETKFSFQEDTIQELNEVIIRQQRQIDELTLRLNRLGEQMEDLQASASGSQSFSLQDEKPPHY